MELWQQISKLEIYDRYWRNMSSCQDALFETSREKHPPVTPPTVVVTPVQVIRPNPSPGLDTSVQMATFSSGAKSSVVKPRYDLVPLRAIQLTAGRFQYGADRHGEKNYTNGKDDPKFIQDRLNHLVEHVMKFVEGRKTSDLAAILCNAAMMAELGVDTVKDGCDGKGEILA